MRKSNDKMSSWKVSPFLILFIPTIMLAQIQAKKWTDGVPTFVHTRAGVRVVVDTTVHLEPVYATSDSDSLNFFLNGIDWTWPQTNIPTGGEAEDIDYRNVSGQDLYLLTDKSDKRVIEVKVTATGIEEVWSSGSISLLLPVDAFSFVENNLDKILITDQGSHRVIKVNRTTKAIEWQYGSIAGSSYNQLTFPADAMKVPDSSQYVIADYGNSRVIIVDEASKNLLWELGADSLKSPVDVEYLPATGEILITDLGRNRVFKIRRDTKEVTWQIGVQTVDGQLGVNAPTDADALANGNVLIADAGNNRIIEVDSTGTIVWQFKQSLQVLRDVDLLPDNRLLAVYLDSTSSKTYPVRLGYKSAWIESDTYRVSTDVNFEQLFWQVDTLAGVTSVQLKVRTGADINELQRSPWYGPKGDTSAVFKWSGDSLGSVHRGDRWYQVRAYLFTSDPRETPVVNSITMRYYYYDSSAPPGEQRPYFYTGPIGLTDETSMPKWKKLIYRTVFPENPARRNDVQFNIRIMNKAGTVRLHEFNTTTLATMDTVNLETVTELQRTKAIFLLGTPITTNSAVTPQLAYWEIQYDSVGTTKSTAMFVNSDGIASPYYRASEPNPQKAGKFDKADIILDDNDSEQFYATVFVLLKARKSGDRLRTDLTLQTPLYFRSLEPIPIYMTSTVDTTNKTLEVLDRDTLIVSYQDVNDPTDVSADSILVLRATEGELAIENSRGVKITRVDFGDLLFVRIKNEQDRNIDLVKRDSVTVTLRNSAPLDEEVLTLYEVANQSGAFDTGEFRNLTGIRVEQNNNGIQNDGKIQSLPGQFITASYVDDFDLNQAVPVPDSGGNVFISLGGAPYVVEVAPNPFYERKYDTFRLRVASATGSLAVSKIEVFNIAGEKVREIPGESLDFSTGLPVPNKVYGLVENWWDLRNDNGNQVASGTYWVKVHADLTSEETGDLERVVFIRKFALIR